MILASKKVIFIVLIQLFFVTINQVKSSPLAKAGIVESGKNLVTKAKVLLQKAKESVTKLIHKVADPLTSYLPSTKNKIIRKFNCFSLASIFHSPVDALINDNTTDASVKFHFASQSKPDLITVAIQNDKLSLDDVDFSPYRDTVLISHGFMSNGKMDWILDMKNAFLKYGDVNVIVVDWEKGSNTWNYIGAAVSTHVVGNEVARLFDHIYDAVLRNNSDLDVLGRIHFVGHSLGSHIVARGANKIQQDQQEKNRPKPWIVNRITGLDPAQPCFIWAENDKRLDKDDAEFVDVIHTNARHLLLMGLGLPDQIGYFDFYPNGGQMQPGCPDYKDSIWTYYLSPGKMKNATICSHGRSYEFFTESLVQAISGNCTFNSHPWDREYNETLNDLTIKKCENEECPVMGINSINHQAHLGLTGIYFVPTGHKKPYCIIKEKDKSLIDQQLKHDASLTKAINAIG